MHTKDTQARTHTHAHACTWHMYMHIKIPTKKQKTTSAYLSRTKCPRRWCTYESPTCHTRSSTWWAWPRCSSPAHSCAASWVASLDACCKSLRCERMVCVHDYHIAVAKKPLASFECVMFCLLHWANEREHAHYSQ